jgi:hypothetical protein
MSAQALLRKDKRYLSQQVNHFRTGMRFELQSGAARCMGKLPLPY